MIRPITSHRQKGFSLVELIIAIAILGLIAAAVIPLLSISYRGIIQSGSRSVDIYQDQATLESQIEDPNFSGTNLGDLTLVFTRNGYDDEEITVYSVNKYVQEPLIYLEAGSPSP